MIQPKQEPLGLVFSKQWLRKVHHSQIEKRRRVKLNDSLLQLRALVPIPDAETKTLHKLDILEATVRYIEHLHTVLDTRDGPALHKMKIDYLLS